MFHILAADNTTTDSGLFHGFFRSDTWMVTRNLGIFFVVVFWLATAYWVYKDARRRIDASSDAARSRSAASANASADVLKAVNAWAQAWSKKDADAYLAFYAADFKTPGGEPRAEWEKGRRSRIVAPKSISVAIASPKVTMSGPNEAKVTFRQTYKSDVLKNTSNKTLVMVKADGRWRIQQERSGG